MTVKTENFDTFTLTDGEPTQVNKWAAWLETKRPVKLFVAGMVQCPNLGVDPILSRESPQGINPRVLLLRLDMVQKPGRWQQRVVEKPAKYSEIPALEEYESVYISLNGTKFVDLKVEKF